MTSTLQELSKIELKLEGFLGVILKYSEENLKCLDLKEACHVLNSYLENSNKKYKNQNTVLKNWVLQEVLKRKTLKNRKETSEIYLEKAVLNSKGF